MLAAGLTRNGQHQRSALRFDTQVTVAQSDLSEGIRAYSDVIAGVKGLIQATGGINRRLLHDYLAGIDLRRQHRGLLALTFGVPLTDAQREAFEARLRMEPDGPGPEFRILPPERRPDYFVVVYGEPEENNRTALGFDTLVLPGQRASLEQAIDTGRLVASAPMKVKQYEGPDPSLVLRQVVYRKDQPVATPEQRRQAVYGCINGVFRAQNLIHAALGAQALQHLEVWIEDLGAALPGYQASTPPTLLFGTPFPKPGYGMARLGIRHEALRTLTVGGRVWRVHFRSRPAPGDNLGWALPLGVFGAGLAITLLLSGLLSSLSQTSQRARQLAFRMTEQLQESESRLQAITQAVPDLLFVLDEDGRYLEIYGGHEGLLAAPRTALLGRTLTEMLPAEVARVYRAALGAALDSHQLQTIGYELETGSGPTTFEARVFEMRTRIHGRRCVVAVARDITERRRAEENQRMTQKLESLGVLAGGIAHDFNNLLTAILGNLNLAQIHVPDESKAAPYLQRVETTVLRAAELAHQMLAYSGRGAISVDLLDLNQVVGEMTELLSVSISKKVTLHFDLAPGLPPIMADAVQIQQVVMNLVTNASEAMDERSGSIHISSGLRQVDTAFLEEQMPTQALQPGPYVTLTVTDTGCGMNAATLNRIFDPFFTTKSTGRGLGLSAMLGILRGHGAGIRITSEPGAGSTFHILFPAGIDTDRPPDAPVASAEPQRALAGTVLVVDDEPMLRTTVTNLLGILGMKVIEAGDGMEALERHAAHAEDIDLVLMDITMPRMDGNEAFLALRQRDPDLPVILCSGFTVQEMVAAPAGTRPADFIQKPYRLQDLKTALERALLGRPGTEPELS